MFCVSCEVMQHHKHRIYQRKNRNGEKSVWYYRKRIPADVVDVWVSNGRRSKEYVVSLGTEDRRVAEKRASREHSKFLNILEIKRQEKRVISSDSHQRIQTHYNYEAYLRSVGAHPEQAPRVNASLKAIEEYNKAVEKVRYGSLTAIGTDPIKTFSGGLKDYQEEVGLEHAFDAHGNEVVVSNQRYDEIERDLEFLAGKRDRSYSASTEVPNLADALEAYTKDVINSKVKTSEYDRHTQHLRATRVVGSLALQLGSGNKKSGMTRPLDTIMNSDAQLFTETLRIRDDGKGNKAWASVKREITLIKAIWNHAYKAYSETWPINRKRDNPFRVIDLKNLEDKHGKEIHDGKILNKKRRPFTPAELKIFNSEYMPKMGIELQLITLIAQHSGCRIGDAAGLLLGDCRLQTSKDRPIPSIKIFSNHIRQVSKGGIEREIPLFGDVFDRLCEYTDGRKGPNSPLFPSYGTNKGASNASAAINKHIKDLRGDDLRLTFHSFRHTLQSKALAAKDIANKFPAYIGGWQNDDAKGLQAEYQTGGIPLKELNTALATIHNVEDWGRGPAAPHQDEWT